MAPDTRNQGPARLFGRRRQAKRHAAPRCSRSLVGWARRLPECEDRSTNTAPGSLGGNPPHQSRCAGNLSSPVAWADAPELCWTTDCPPMQELSLPTDLRHDAIDVLSFPSRRANLILGILAKIEDTRQTDSFRPPGVGDAVARSKTTSRAFQCLSAEVVVVGESQKGAQRGIVSRLSLKNEYQE